jgi:hypothetical protein
MRLKLYGLIFVVSAFFLLTATQATTLARLSLDQLAAGADAVARVRCASAESRWENGSIWTVTTAEVVETIKGSLPHEISVRLPGGRVGHFTASVDGTPKFQPGDEASVLLGAPRIHRRRLGRGNVSDFARRPNRRGNGSAGFKRLRRIRPCRAHVSERRDSSPAARGISRASRRRNRARPSRRLARRET